MLGLCVFSLGVLTLGGILLILTSIKSGNRLVSMPIYMWQVYLCVPVSGIFSTLFLFDRILSEGAESEKKGGEK
ncbi:MAG: hypothetical protein ACLUKN_12210 [Bacilli bacterium]